MLHYTTIRVPSTTLPLLYSTLISANSCTAVSLTVSPVYTLLGGIYTCTDSSTIVVTLTLTPKDPSDVDQCNDHWEHRGFCIL